MEDVSVTLKFMKSDTSPPMKSKLLLSIEGKKGELDRCRPFPPGIVAKLREQFTIEWTYNSNAI